MHSRLFFLIFFVLLSTSGAWARESWELRAQGVSQTSPLAEIDNSLPSLFLHPVEPLSPLQIQSLFNDLKKLDLPFEYTRDCCHERGYSMSQWIWNNFRLPHLRVFAEGDLTPPKNKWGEVITWKVHTAPAVMDRQRVIWILDPALLSEPLPLVDWLKKFVSPGAAVKVSLGHQYVYNTFDLDERSSPPSTFDRPIYQELVAGGLIGCAHLQNQKNKSLKTVSPERVEKSCLKTSASLPHTQAAQVSDFWAQRLVGLDLANELIEKLQREGKISAKASVHVWDETINWETGTADRAAHGASVASFFYPGPQSSSVAAEIRSNQDVIHNTNDYNDAAQSLVKSASANSDLQFINLSAGWRTFSERIAEAFNQIFSKNVLVVKAAGNRPFTSPEEFGFEPPDSRFLRVGDITPEGFVSSTSAIRSEELIFAPADLFLTAKAGPKGSYSRFAQTSGATPLVTGALASAWAVTPRPNLHSKDELRKLLFSTALVFKTPQGQNSHQVLNAFRLVMESLDPVIRKQELEALGQRHAKSEAALAERFPLCFMNPRAATLAQTCEDPQADLKNLRAQFFLKPDILGAQRLACLYGHMELSREARFFENWSLSQEKKLSHEMERQIQAGKIPAEVLRRNSLLLTPEAARRVVKSAREKGDVTSVQQILLLRAADLNQELATHYASLNATDKVKFLGQALTIPAAVRILLPLAARESNFEIRMRAIDAIIYSNPMDLKKVALYLIDAKDSQAERIWIKFGNYLRYYEPKTRYLIVKKLITKPSELVQMQVLEGISLLSPVERKSLLQEAATSTFAAVRKAARSIK